MRMVNDAGYPLVRVAAGRIRHATNCPTQLATSPSAGPGPAATTSTTRCGRASVRRHPVTGREGPSCAGSRFAASTFWRWSLSAALLVRRCFDPQSPDRLRRQHHLTTGQGWLYWCAVRDGRSRRVLGWAITDHLRADLVHQALTMAFVLRGQLPAQVIFHADGDVNTPRPRSPTCVAISVCCSRWADRGLLGQRRHRVVLVHPEDRVLPPPRLGHQSRSSSRGRPLDRGAVQPTPATPRST